MERLTDPKFQLKMHLGIATFWLLMVAPSAIFLSSSLPYVVGASVWANLYAAVSAYQACQGEIDNGKKLDKIIRLLQDK